MEERIQKILARVGLGSRRSCEELILEGRVRVNGKEAVLGQKADQQKDDILVDGEQIQRSTPKKVYIALNKPRGVLSDINPQDSRKNIRDLVPFEGQLFAVGRLDLDSDGLMLLTNDGELANRLTHPKFGHEKEYRVLAVKRPDAKQIATWERGIILEDGYKTKPCQVIVDETIGNNAWLTIILREGRKRQIRESGSRIGVPIKRITRVRIGKLKLGNLEPKQWRMLKEHEVKLLTQLNDSPPTPRKKNVYKKFEPKKTGRPNSGTKKKSGRPDTGKYKKTGKAQKRTSTKSTTNSRYKKKK
ncbi:MAG: rRNA pseudouridine synthase [Anaerolineaceae bacterium]|nr:rRNA pseudouridine synthase [Anaerolineaceae bacterium]